MTIATFSATCFNVYVVEVGRKGFVSEYLQGPAGLRHTPEAAECVRGWGCGPPAWPVRHEVTAGLSTAAVPCWTTACMDAA